MLSILTCLRVCHFCKSLQVWIVWQRVSTSDSGLTLFTKRQNFGCHQIESFCRQNELAQMIISVC